MATERLSMRQTREILRQKWGLGRTHREVAQSLGISSGAVGTTVLRARAAWLDWAQVDALNEAALQARVYGPPTPPTHHRAVPDCAYLHAERRKPGVTLELLHLEYLEQHPDGYRYTQFCECYRRWLRRRGFAMRHVHRAGEKCFVDYAGTKPRIIEATTGEVIAVELFVAVLGASNYTYAEATRTQQVPDWIASHQRAFQFLVLPGLEWVQDVAFARPDRQGPSAATRLAPRALDDSLAAATAQVSEIWRFPSSMTTD